MSKTSVKTAEEQEIDRVQLLVRVPRLLHRALKHAAVDRDTSMNELVIIALEQWSAKELEGAKVVPERSHVAPLHQRKGK
jgi:predicted HicB family RNase H-like nuclease